MSAIRMIRFATAIQLPGNAGATGCYNRNTHQTIRVERCELGFELHFGKLVDKQWVASGSVKTVTWNNVLDFDEERTPATGTAQNKEQKK